MLGCQLVGSQIVCYNQEQLAFMVLMWDMDRYPFKDNVWNILSFVLFAKCPFVTAVELEECMIEGEEN
jgi:fructose/tagatose bisphosphate aldolase